MASKKHFDPSGPETHFSNELKSEIGRVCRNFLGGSWSEVPIDKISVTHLRGGLTNLIFVCELPIDFCEKNALKCNSKSKVLLRIYCNPEIESRVVSESVVFSLLAERNVGPKLYGVFPDGRLEEFIQSRTLETADIWKPDLSRKIARKLADLHKLSLPIEKSPTYLIEAMERWISKLIEIDSSLSMNIGADYPDITCQFLQNELDMINQSMQLSNSRIVFCHNDLQEGNILMSCAENDNNKVADKMVIIDYEYASYNYRGFDFANHFCEWIFEYTAQSEQGFLFYPEKFPNEKEQRNFFRAYLEKFNSNSCEMIEESTVEKIVKETAIFVPVSHFFWALWALVQHHTAPIEFDFLAYSKLRFRKYFDSKSNLLTVIDDCVNNNEFK